MKSLPAFCNVRLEPVIYLEQLYLTHQNSRSQQTSKVPDLLCDVVTCHGRAAGEEEQDVAEHTHDAQRNQADPQTLGKASRTHSDADASRQ